MTQVTSLSSSPSPIVSMYNGKPTTTSLNVAEVFSKRHDNVVRDIRVLSDNVPETFYALNFEESSYINEQGKEQPMLTLTRDGLTLLVMGYTGKKAMQFKLAYIEAFSQMEAQLEGQSVTDCHQLPGTTTPSTAADRAPLRALVNAWAQVTGVHHAALWPQLKAHFQLSRIDDLPVEWMPDALAFVQGKIDAHQTHAATASAALPEAPAMDVPPAAAQTRKQQAFVERLRLTQWEKFCMGKAHMAILEKADKAGPRTLECILLKLRYLEALHDMSKLVNNLAADLDRVRIGVFSKIVQAGNQTNCMTDPVMDILCDDTWLLRRLGDDLHTTAFRGLNASICAAKMLGL